MTELENQIIELVQNIVNNIGNKYTDNKIYFWTSKDLFNGEYVNLTKFCEYDQVNRTIFALWALQNPNVIKYDIVYAQSASDSKLVMVFYTDASGGFYFDSTQDRLEKFESNTKFPSVGNSKELGKIYSHSAPEVNTYY
ncbi:560_t:CDS:1 [Paraglomus brasilianum]|uniref:560_t:CDS:1 n=1 Tax=Paraglomus brasilianum TaxID=144538 RepID=A0A9N9FWC3_9GLOM|nr:560_t:CDS:1 [Paraglomus brasilianum]